MISVCLLLDLYVTLYPMSTSAGQHLEPVRQQMQRPGKKVSFRLHLFFASCTLWISRVHQVQSWFGSAQSAEKSAIL